MWWFLVGKVKKLLLLFKKLLVRNPFFLLFFAIIFKLFTQKVLKNIRFVLKVIIKVCNIFLNFLYLIYFYK